MTNQILWLQKGRILIKGKKTVRRLFCSLGDQVIALSRGCGLWKEMKSLERHFGGLRGGVAERGVKPDPFITRLSN